MPSVPYTLQRRVGRFRDQRWLLDAVIKLVGPEFDQSRLQYLSAPLSPDHRGPVMGLQALVKRWDDIAPEFAGVARRFEVQARAAAVQGHDVSAGDAFFAASVMYGGAQWPIFADTDLLQALERKKTECFLEYASGPIITSSQSRCLIKASRWRPISTCRPAMTVGDCRVW